MSYVQTSFDRSIGGLSSGKATIGGGGSAAVRTGVSGGDKGKSPDSSYGQALSRASRQEMRFLKENDPYGYEFIEARNRIGRNMRAQREAREAEREAFFSGRAGPWGAMGQPRTEKQWRADQFRRGTEEGQQYGMQQAEAYRGRGLEGDYRQTMSKWMENERKKPFAF